MAARTSPRPAFGFRKDRGGPGGGPGHGDGPGHHAPARGPKNPPPRWPPGCPRPAKRGSHGSPRSLPDVALMPHRSRLIRPSAHLRILDRGRSKSPAPHAAPAAMVTPRHVAYDHDISTGYVADTPDSSHILFAALLVPPAGTEIADATGERARISGTALPRRLGAARQMPGAATQARGSPAAVDAGPPRCARARRASRQPPAP